MARTANDVHEPRILKVKDKVRLLDQQLTLTRLEAGRLMAEAVKAGVRRTTIATWWNTTTVQVDRMMARSRDKR